MSKCFNRAALTGTIENEPILRAKKDGSLITNIVLITIEQWLDKKTKEKKESVEKHHIVLSSNLEKNFAQLVKGCRLYVEGSIQTRRWISKTTGETCSRKVIACDYYRFLKEYKIKSHDKLKKAEVKESQQSTIPQNINIVLNQLPTIANNAYGTL